MRYYKMSVLICFDLRLLVARRAITSSLGDSPQESLITSQSLNKS